ncbi:MAG: TolC family protein [Dysgonamonadaceae bacterium]|jgi:outer membrane protein TolC|nr:TolC family protein [Dysgonamonadaceae bacterium]
MTVKRTKAIIICITIIYAGMSEARSQSATLTLKKCLEYAVESSHSMTKVRMESVEASAKTKQTRSSILPQVDASVSLTDNLAIPVVMLPGEIIGQSGEMIPAELGVPYEAGLTVQLSQVIFNPALFTGIKAARSVEELMLLKTKMTKEQLIYDVASVYYDILHSMQELESISANLNLQDSLYAKTDLRVREDLAREIDRDRIRINISDLKVRQARLNTVIEQQKRYLQVLTGMPPNENFSLDNSVLTETGFPEKRLLYDENSLSQKTELAVLKHRKQLNRMELKATQMQYLPTLSLVASGAYQFQSERFQLNDKTHWFKSAFVGLRLNIPLFDGVSKHHNSKQIKLQGMMLDNDIDYAEQSIRMEQKNAMSELIVSHQSAKSQEENLRLAEKVYDRSRMLYQEGLYNVTDLLQTETSLREAQIAHISELIRFKKAELNWMKAEGTLEKLMNNSNK